MIKKFDLSAKFKEILNVNKDNGHIKKYIDRWWTWNITKAERIRIIRTAETDDSTPSIIEKKLSIQQVDKKVHQMIHNLILMGEEDSLKKHRVHLKSHMLEHQDRIIFVKECIKPGFIN